MPVPSAVINFGLCVKTDVGDERMERRRFDRQTDRRTGQLYLTLCRDRNGPNKIRLGFSYSGIETMLNVIKIRSAIF
jgi:hypothetical protein